MWRRWGKGGEGEKRQNHFLGKISSDSSGLHAVGLVPCASRLHPMMDRGLFTSPLVHGPLRVEGGAPCPLLECITGPPASSLLFKEETTFESWPDFFFPVGLSCIFFTERVIRCIIIGESRINSKKKGHEVRPSEGFVSCERERWGEDTVTGQQRLVGFRPVQTSARLVTQDE